MTVEQCLSNPLSFIGQETVDLFYSMGGRKIRAMLKLLIKNRRSYPREYSFSEARMLTSFITMTHMLLRPGHHRFSRKRLPPHVYLRRNGLLAIDTRPWCFEPSFINLIYNFNRFQTINYKFKIRKLSHNVDNLAYFDSVIFDTTSELNDDDFILFEFINGFYFRSCTEKYIPLSTRKFFYCKEDYKFYFGDMFVKFYKTSPLFTRPVFGVVHEGRSYIILSDGGLVLEGQLSKDQLYDIKKQRHYGAQLDIFLNKSLSRAEYAEFPYLDIKNIGGLIK